MPSSFADVERTISSNAKTTNITEEELLNDEAVQLVMARKLGAKRHRVQNWSLDRIPLTNGFLGQYYHLRVLCSFDDGKNEKFRFFAKTKPARNSSQYEFATESNVFKREVTFYKDIASKMGKGQGPKWMVDYYLSKNDAIIVLEDATLEGFSMPDKFAPFEYDECIALIRTMARLHSRSIVLDETLRRECGKNLGQCYGDILQEALFPNDDRTSRNAIAPAIQGTCGFIDLIDCLDDRSKHRIKSVINDWCWRIPRLVRTSKKYRNVICHRDPWANNMLIKRNPSDGRPDAFYLIDFQFIRYSPPAIDFLLSLYLTTRRETRDVHLDEFTKIYHDNVREELERENLDIDDCDLSWKVFRESCEYYRLLAIIYVTANQQIMLIDEKSADRYFTKTPELLERVLWGCGRQELVCPIFAEDCRYRERIVENIMEIHERLDDFEFWKNDDY